MTYRQLQRKLNKLSDEQLDQDVTIGLTGTVECYAVDNFRVVENSDHDVFAGLFDEDQMILIVHDGNNPK